MTTTTDLDALLARELPCENLSRCDTTAVGSARGWAGHDTSCCASLRPALRAALLPVFEELRGLRAAVLDLQTPRGPDSIEAENERLRAELATAHDPNTHTDCIGTFDKLKAELAQVRERTIEECAALYESISPVCDHERTYGDPGAGAIGAVIDYRDAIRALLTEEASDELRRMAKWEDRTLMCVLDRTANPCTVCGEESLDAKGPSVCAKHDPGR